LAAFLPIFATPLASVGVLATVQALKSIKGENIQALVHRADKRLIPVISGAGLLALAATLVAATQFGALRQYIVDSKGFYTFDAGSPILSPDEAALLQRVPSIVPKDAVIADNPWNGSSLAYALSDRKVLVYHLFSGIASDATALIEGLAGSPDNERICAAAKANNVKFVLDFGDYYLAQNASADQYPGVTNINDSTRLSLVDSEGQAKLYKLDDCH
jgi:hypothetical protein